MSIFSKDRDEKYDEYLSEGSMFGKMDRQEFDRLHDRAEEISSGLVMGTFERDERVWEIVKKLEDEK